MPYRVVYYHVVWATKNRSELIGEQIEPVIFAAIRQKSRDLKSPIHALNGTRDHVHVAVSIHTSVSVATWVKGVKGVSAFAVNNTFPDLPDRFGWQAGYSVHTFGHKALPTVVSYIDGQKTHHQAETMITYLEQLPDE